MTETLPPPRRHDPGGSPRSGGESLGFAAAAGFVLFVVWALADFIYVRSSADRGGPGGGPGYDGWFDLSWLVLTVGVAAAAYRFLRGHRPASRVVRSIAIAVAAVVFGVVLLLFVGIPFHLAIGGRL